MKHWKRREGYFYGLNGESKEKAFNAFLDDCVEPFETKEAALDDAEEQRAEGNFMDDNATVQVYHMSLKLSEVE